MLSAREPRSFSSRTRTMINSPAFLGWFFHKPIVIVYFFLVALFVILFAGILSCSISKEIPLMWFLLFSPSFVVSIWCLLYCFSTLRTLKTQQLTCAHGCRDFVKHS